MRRAGLAVTICLAVLAVGCVSAGLLLFDPRVNGADALRTGGLAGGSVVALYALWLNDRRRRVEENRHELERDQTALDRERVGDERFARAVELLGHETDQVRVGALHALAGLARSNPGQTQTVLDVLCAYLRRPFRHPRYDGGEWSRFEREEAERQLQVRLTAQRLIGDLVPRADEPGAPAYNLDLTNATLEYLELADRRIGTLTMRYARLFSSSNLSRCAITGAAWLTGTTIGVGVTGKFRCQDTTFHQRAQFSGVEFGGPALFDRAEFRGEARFNRAALNPEVSFEGARFEEPISTVGAECTGAEVEQLFAAATIDAGAGTSSGNGERPARSASGGPSTSD